MKRIQNNYEYPVNIMKHIIDFRITDNEEIINMDLDKVGEFLTDKLNKIIKTRLNENDQLILLYKFKDGLSYLEISKKMNMSVSTVSRNVKKNLNKILFELNIDNNLSLIESEEIYHKSIRELKLSVYTTNRLIKNGINNIGKLRDIIVNYGSEYLKNIKLIGSGSVCEIVTKMNEFGYITYEEDDDINLDNTDITPDSDISNLRINARIYNSLYRGNVRKVKELISSIESGEIKKLRGMGKDSYKYLSNYLVSIGLLDKKYKITEKIVKPAIKELDDADGIRIGEIYKHKLTGLYIQIKGFATNINDDIPIVIYDRIHHITRIKLEYVQGWEFVTEIKLNYELIVDD